jgi:butyryl-CoA dehydrogenase
MRENPVERLYRELRVDRIWEGTSEIMRLVVGNHVGKRGVTGLLALPMPAPEPAAGPAAVAVAAGPAAVAMSAGPAAGDG